MTNPSTDSLAEPTVEYLGLRFVADHYYLKRTHIVEKILFRNRTFYAKFERIDEVPTDLLFEQHRKEDYTVALPLLHHDKTRYLVIDYDGNDPTRFIYLARYVMQCEGIETFRLFRGKKENRIQLFIETSPLSLEEAQTRLEKLSSLFEAKMPKEWKTLPSSTLPKAYNIVTLPIENIEL